MTGEPASSETTWVRTVCENSEPRPAIPVAIPIWRNVELIPLAIPARSGVTTPIAVEASGGLTRPTPGAGQDEARG